MQTKTVTVNIPETKAHHYPIIIGENLLEEIGEILKHSSNIKKILIITNPTVLELYGNIVEKSLEDSGFETDFCVIEDGEEFKNVHSLNKIWEDGLNFKLERSDLFLALGGGVIGDITGFAAATFLRGISFIQVPTTLLAQVDSSVGGKTAINHALGKNLIGAFYQPKLVLTDINTLKTLPAREIKTGLAEVIKYGFIEKNCVTNQNDFLRFLDAKSEEINNLDPETMIELIDYCCQLKASVVNQDEKEQGLRAVLNLGHTIGHAVEKATAYSKYNHGEAVSLGLIGAFKISKALMHITESYYEYAISIIKKYELTEKLAPDIDPDEIFKSTALDKKVQHGKRRFILPVDEGKTAIFDDIDDKIILDAIKKLY